MHVNLIKASLTELNNKGSRELKSKVKFEKIFVFIFNKCWKYK